MNNIQLRASRYFRNKKHGYRKEKISELVMNSKNNIITDPSEQASVKVKRSEVK
jgi:hypothetical protein